MGCIKQYPGCDVALTYTHTQASRTGNLNKTYGLINQYPGCDVGLVLKDIFFGGNWVKGT